MGTQFKSHARYLTPEERAEKLANKIYREVSDQRNPAKYLNDAKREVRKLLHEEVGTLAKMAEDSKNPELKQMHQRLEKVELHLDALDIVLKRVSY
jgi:hypothetical protein